MLSYIHLNHAARIGGSMTPPSVSGSVSQSEDGELARNEGHTSFWVARIEAVSSGSSSIAEAAGFRASGDM